MTDDPWSSIAKAGSSTTLTGKRVSERHEWAFYWARDASGAPMFLLRHEQDPDDLPDVPTLRGLSISHDRGSDGNAYLKFSLEDASLRGVFHRLALDVIDAGENEETEQAAVHVSILRTWRWHHLLRGGSSGLLSIESQKGLIGELTTLERVVLEELSPLNAVLTWTGPLGSPKDFEIGDVAIESKARRGAAAPFVAISSEHQLEQAGFSRLFLHVTSLQRASSEDDSFTVTDIARRIDERLSASPAAAVAFAERLAATGFLWEDDYSAYPWIESGRRAFEVGEDFPRVVGSSLPVGVRDVRYSVELNACDAWEVVETSMNEAVTGGEV